MRNRASEGRRPPTRQDRPNAELVIDSEPTQNDDNSSDAAGDRSIPPIQFKPSIFSSRPIDPQFGALVRKIEGLLGVQVWLLVQSRKVLPGDATPLDSLGFAVAESFRHFNAEASKGKVALLIHSPGGEAKAAYQLAKTLRGQCQGFVAIVPRYAKSAATLLCLGAERIVMSGNAELARTIQPGGEAPNWRAGSLATRAPIQVDWRHFSGAQRSAVSPLRSQGV